MKSPFKIALSLIGIAVCLEAIRQSGAFSALSSMKAVQDPGAKMNLSAGSPFKQCTDIDKPVDGCYNWLHNAVRKKDLREIKELIGKGADIEEKNCLGQTPLLSAIATGFPEGVKTLLDLGADLENPRYLSDVPATWPVVLLDPQREDYISTPLLYTSFYRANKAAKVLVERGAKVFDPAVGSSPFAKAYRQAKDRDDLVFLKILTRTDSHPAFSSCKTLDGFLDLLFEKPNLEKVRAEWEKFAQSSLVKEISSLPVPEMPEREFASADELIGYLLEQNPRFKIAWNEVPQERKEAMKRALPFPLKSDSLKSFFGWVGLFFTDQSESIYQTLCKGETALDEALTESRIEGFYLYAAELLSGSNLSVEDFLSPTRSEVFKSDDEAIRHRWKEKTAVSFFTTHQDWLSKRIEQLRKIV